MEQIHPNSNMAHVVHVFPSSTGDKVENHTQLTNISQPSMSADHSSKLSYQEAISSEMAMACQQNQLHNMQSVTMQSQAIHTDIHHQFASQIFMPHLHEPFLTPYEEYLKQQCYSKDKVEKKSVEQQTVNENLDYDQDSGSSSQPENPPTDKRRRGVVPNPSTWACNVRKIKHQSGEAYISRRGKYVPERKIKSTKDCLTSCKSKCNKKISDTDRELIFKAFYSLTSNEKKHFLLNTTERHEVRHPKVTQSKRHHTFKYYFLVRGTRHSVCKNFYLGTLSISQKPVYNVHAGKSEMNIPKPDGRGLSTASYHGLPSSVKDTVREHIMSFKTVDSNPLKQFSKKQQYLVGNYTIKQMYNMYLEECNNKHIYAVKQSMYRKILKQEFNIHFAKAKPNQLCAKCKEPIKKNCSENNKC